MTAETPVDPESLPPCSATFELLLDSGETAALTCDLRERPGGDIVGKHHDPRGFWWGECACKGQPSGLLANQDDPEIAERLEGLGAALRGRDDAT